MIRTAFAIAVAAMAFTAVSGISQAAPIAPLPAAVTTGVGQATPVWYRRHYYHYGYVHRYHRCWHCY